MSTVKDLSRLLAQKASLESSDSSAFVAAFFDIIKEDLLKDGIVKVKGLGTFKMMTVKQRESVNVNTGERVIIDSHDRISFTPDASMRDAVNKPFSQFETVVLNEGVTFDDLENASEESNGADPETVAEPAVEKPAAGPTLEPAVEPTVEPTAEPAVEPVVEPTVEPVIEPTVESAIEPAVEPTIEPVVKPVVAPLVNPIAKEEKTVTPPEPTPAAEPENEVKTEEKPAEPVKEEKPATAKEDIPVVYAISCGQVKRRLHRIKRNIRQRRIKKAKRILSIASVVLLIFAVGFAAGWFASNTNWADLNLFGNKQETVTQPPKPKAAPEKIASVVDTTQQDDEEAAEDASLKQQAAEKAAAEKAIADQMAAEKAAAEQAAKEAEAKKAAEKAAKEAEKAAKEAEEKAKEAEEAAQKQYNSDPRIKHGAYRIVGVDKTIKVKHGQTLQSISNTYLGKGMECYVEALNGKSVKAGQTVKIPKLQIKKKKH